MKKIFLFWVLLFPFLAIYGQDGTLDPSFNSVGWKSFSFGNTPNYNDDEGYNIMKQSDGKYVFLDYVTNNGIVVLVRYNSDGTIDNSYGTAGFSEQPEYMNIRAAAIQSDDKVVVGGYIYQTDPYFAVARFKTDGTLDSTFGTNGIASAPIAPYGLGAGQAIAIDNTGRIVLAGGVYGLGSFPYLVARFSAAGALDTEFNSGGIATVTFGTNSMLSSVAIQTDGKVVIGGSSLYPYVYNFDLARFISDGSTAGTLDPSFGAGGMVTSTIGGGVELYALAIQGDNKIVAGGAAQVLNKKGTLYTPDFVLMRYNNDGSLDPTFNAGSTYTGTLTTDFGANDKVHSIAITANTIVAAGSSEGKTQNSIAIARYLLDGTPDKTFAKNGMLLASYSGSDVANSVVVESNNAITIVGTSFNTAAANYDVLVARYTAAGTLDKTFNATGATAGVAYLYYSVPLPSIITSVAVQPDGKILIGGTTIGYDPSTGAMDYLFAVGRLYPDGTLDNSFGNAGYAFANIGSDRDGLGFCLAIAPVTGKIVMGGFLSWYNGTNTQYDFALAQFTAAGIPDKSFGDNGLVTTYVNGYSIFSIVIQPDGKIVAGGPMVYNMSDNTDFVLARYTTSGLLDRTFGGTGTVSVDFMGASDQLTKLALVNGNILAVGGATNSNTSMAEFALAQFTTDGIPDGSFGTNGKVMTGFPGKDAMATSVVIEGTGQVVVFGVASDVDSSYVLLTRYSSTGVPDETFGPSGGVVTVAYTGFNPSGSIFLGQAGLIQDDGKLIVVSVLDAVAANDYNNYFGATRLTESGLMDDTWGTSGNMISDLPVDAQFINATWNNGRLYTGGLVSGKEVTGFIAVYRAGESRVLIPSISIDDVSVPASAGTATLTVSMNATSTSPIIVNYATKDNTATTKGRTPDYQSSKGAVTILAGNTSTTIVIPIYDRSAQIDKSFFVNLSLNSEMVKLVSVEKATGTVTITAGTFDLTSQNARVNNQGRDETLTGKLGVKAMPNPSTGAFNLELHSASSAPASIRIMDISGRLIESKTGLSPNKNIQLGYNYLPGIYYAEVVQGSEKVVVRLVKQ